MKGDKVLKASWQNAAGDVCRVERKPDGSGWEFVYDPMTPINSSSGHYSGGEPARCDLTDKDFDTIWSAFTKAIKDREHHGVRGLMGRGQITVVWTDPSQEPLSLCIKMSTPPFDDLVAVFSPFRPQRPSSRSAFFGAVPDLPFEFIRPPE